jgi:hypothetical protein
MALCWRYVVQRSLFGSKAPLVLILLARGYAALGWLVRRKWLLVVVLTGLLIEAVAVLQTKGGYIHQECRVYHVQLLSSGSLAKKIFDPNSLEIRNAYQARELSYLLDWVDYRLIDWTIRNGRCYYISVTSVVCFFLIGLLIWTYYARDLKAPPSVAYGAALLFWTSPTIFMYVVHFRSAKPLVMLTLAISLILTRTLARRGVRGGWYAVVLGNLFLSLNLMGLADRQGYFAVCGYLVVSSFLFWAVRERVWLHVAAACLITTILNNMYNYLIAPNLIHALNGYYPSFSYQSNSEVLAILISHPTLAISGLFCAVIPLRCLFWDLPPIVCFAVPPFLWYRMKGEAPLERLPSQLTIIISLLIYVMSTLMVVRHHYIFYFYDLSRYLYYGPAMVLLVFLLPLAWSRLGINIPTSWNGHFVPLLIGMLVLNNLLGCYEYRLHAAFGHNFEHQAWSGKVIQGLNALFGRGVQSEDDDMLGDPIYRFYLDRWQR